MSQRMTAEQFRNASKVRKNRGVEQLVARGTHNPEAAGSSPAPATRPKSGPSAVGGQSKGTRSARGRVTPLEARVHEAFCKYVATKYPSFIFTSESSGVRLTMGQSVKAKKLRSGSGLPDFWLAEPRGKFHGFFLELKRSHDEVYTKGGILRNTPHIREQAEVLAELRLRDYYAEFGLGLNDCINKLEDYLKP